MKISKLKLTQFLIMFLLVIIAIAPLLDDIMNYKLLNFSFFVTILPSILIFSIYFLMNNRIKKSSQFYILVLIILQTYILLVRSYLYDESLINLLSKQYFVILTPMILAIFCYLHISNFHIDIIYKLLISLLIFNFIISLLYIFNLPTIQIADKNSPDYYDFGRYTGIMGGANVQGNFIAVIFLITITQFNSEIYIKRNLFLFLISLIAVLPTLSRSSITIIIISYILVSFKYLSLKKSIYLSSIVLFSIYYFSKYIDFSAIGILYNSLLDRLDSNNFSGGRIDKFIYTIDLLFSNLKYFLFGIPTELHAISRITISDNSLTLLLSNLGFPFTVLFIYIVYTYFKKTKDMSKVYIFTLILVFILNNSILWLSWIVYASFGNFIVSNKQNLIDSASKVCLESDGK